MIKLQGSLSQEFTTAYDVVVICTNGTVKKNGENVMGKRGGAWMANLIKPLPKAVGEMITTGGNTVHTFRVGKHTIVTFPTKRNFWDIENPAFIEGQLKSLVEYLQKLEGKILVEYPAEQGDVFYEAFEKLGDNVFVCR